MGHADLNGHADVLLDRSKRRTSSNNTSGHIHAGCNNTSGHIYMRGANHTTHLDPSDISMLGIFAGSSVKLSISLHVIPHCEKWTDGQWRREGISDWRFQIGLQCFE